MTFYFLKNFIFSSRAGNLIRSIALLCILGVFVSVVATILVVSIMLGFNDSIHDRTLALQPHFELDQTNLSREQRAQQQQEIYGSLAQEYPMQVFSGQSQDLLLRTVDGLFSGVQAIGVEAREWLYIWEKVQAKNELYGEIDLERNEIAVGIDLARDLAIYEGDEIVLVPPEQVISFGLENPVYEKVRVKKVLQTDVPEIDAKAIFYDNVLSLRRLGVSEGLRYYLSLRLQNNSDFDAVQAWLQARNIPFTSWKEKNKAMLFALNMEKMAMSSFLLFTVMIASFSIFTVLSLLISQKKKDIGILLTLGMSPKKVSRIFTHMGLMLSGFGALLGTIVALTLAYILKKYGLLNLPADIYYDHKVPIRMDYNLIGIVIFVSLLLSFLGAWIPARWSAQEEIVELLRDRSSTS